MADWYMHWKGVYQKRIAELQAENERLQRDIEQLQTEVDLLREQLHERMG